ncbi:hypothetical protein GGF37_004057, partial [Kickxella alabastrina]
PPGAALRRAGAGAGRQRGVAGGRALWQPQVVVRHQQVAEIHRGLGRICPGPVWRLLRGWPCRGGAARVAVAGACLRADGCAGGADRAERQFGRAFGHVRCRARAAAGL